MVELRLRRDGLTPLPVVLILILYFAVCGLNDVVCLVGDGTYLSVD